MAATQVVYSVYMSVNLSVEDKGIVATAIAYGFNALVNTFSKLIIAVLKTLGFDLSILNPANFFMMTHLIVMVIGWTTLFTAAFIYKLSGSNPIFGKGLSKAGTFLLAMICYSIPIMNLFPWFFIWTLTVMKNPK